MKDNEQRYCNHCHRKVKYFEGAGGYIHFAHLSGCPGTQMKIGGMNVPRALAKKETYTKEE